MPDAITHAAGARLLGTLWTPERRAILYVGALLPDLAEKGIRVALSSGDFFAAPAHSIVGATLLCGALAILFDAEIRREVFGLLWVGMMTHLALDLLKDPGEGRGVPIFFPFVTEGYGLGLFRSEETLYAVPASLAVLGLFEARAAKDRLVRAITIREISWCLNAGTLAAATVFLFLYCQREGRDLNPSVAACKGRPADFDGRLLWVPAATVVGPDTIEVQDARIRVTGGGLPAAGTGVSLSAVFRAGAEPTLEARGVHVARTNSNDVVLVYGASIAALAVVVFLLSRRLRLDGRALFSPRLPWPTS